MENNWPLSTNIPLASTAYKPEDALLMAGSLPQFPPIVVVGSINMDLVVRTAQMPLPGQTVIGQSLTTIPGGKGANQAVAVARLGESVGLVGKVGNDDFGLRMIRALQSEMVNTDYVCPAENVNTGTALITVDETGENAICVIPGANHCVGVEDIDLAEPMIAEARYMLLQLELPLETVIHAKRLAQSHGVKVILNPAPAIPDPAPELLMVDYLVPNELEASMLAGESSNDMHAAKLLGSTLVRLGASAVVITLGARGSVAVQHDLLQNFPPYKVPVVDTTAAGDVFTAALTVSLQRGRDLGTAARHANAAAALTCTQFGAQSSLPYEQQWVRLIHRGIIS